MNIVILAAGKGKRMRSDLPKVLHSLAGTSLLGHVLSTARGLAPGQLVVVIGHGAHHVQAAFPNAAVTWATQTEQLGTGHAVQQAVAYLDDATPTLVLYGDVPLTRIDTLRALLDAAGTERLGLLTAHVSDPTGYGRIVREGTQVSRIVEHKDATPEEHAINEINTGILVAPTPFLKRALGALRNDNAQAEYYLTDIVGIAVAEHLPVVTTQPAHVFEIEGVNSKAQLAALERIYQHSRANDLLEAGVTLADPARIDIRGELTHGQDVFIDVGCVFEGRVHLGDGAHVGPYAVLRNVEVGARTRVEAYCHLVDAVVGAEVSVGPFARLRPGATLEDGAHIGNFVEVKNSVIGKGSKANHLAYVGDATVGQRVNIGAGTITCNYDGANKYRTIIEDDVFIGSDTQLIAPVTVKRGATLGAGTTLTKDAPEDQLTLSRAKQMTIPGWKRPVKKPRA
ncbi:MAG TPA: bifunctional UDP-N-acetylglucosamine diphosphorylase/glucosamine-1-phosphate N-acetyltransferase GlmU [Burkholderiaceae bacterium]|nr:bifunctional UDP-N-acetylglucosamine diphosphorylase/glucosamine-1-phosphate N-acetyltransferase GlmU [Burkholderiaceae bacterium]